MLGWRVTILKADRPVGKQFRQTRLCGKREKVIDTEKRIQAARH